MRLVIALIGIAAAGVPCASAQERQFGGKAGASIASVSAEEGGDAYGVRSGLTGGVFTVLPASRHLALQLEMLVTERGGSLPIDDPTIVQGSRKSRYLFQYLDVPVLARLTMSRSSARAIHAFAGPMVSVRTSAKAQDALVGLGGGAFGIEDDIGGSVKRFDAGLVVGGGVDVGRRLVIDGRYSWGLLDVNRGDTDVYRVRNRGFAVMAGMRF